MAFSLRTFFERPRISTFGGTRLPQPISVRRALGAHLNMPHSPIGAAARGLTALASGDGWSRGCHRPSQAIAGDLAYVVPSWVSVVNAETRVLEGVLERSHVTNTDFPLRPWHSYYDWNFHIRPDRPYRYLLARSNDVDESGLIECEWDTANFPMWAWPMDNSRVWMVGRWIYDCGHPGDVNANDAHRTELHPPKAFAWFRPATASLSANAPPVRTNAATVYIGRNGGYWRQPINDMNYTFDLFLPPRPYPQAQSAWVARPTPGAGALQVQPTAMAYPATDPRLFQVTIPLQGANPHPEEYGVIVHAGWTDPLGNQQSRLWAKRVRLDTVFMDGDYDAGPDEWHVYLGVNGTWNVWRDMSGWSFNPGTIVDLILHEDDPIRINGCGFEADLMHDYMGRNSGYSWATIANPAISVSAREAIEDDIFWQLSGSWNDENDPIGYLSVAHPASATGTFTASAGDWRLRYTISNR